jgi:hypothetical protein
VCQVRRYNCAMSRWLRAFVIALLLPAYGLAAVGVVAFTSATSGAGNWQIEGQQNHESLGDTFEGNVADLAFELGDTSDDAPEFPMTVRSPLVLACAPEGFAAISDARTPTNAPDSALRPPDAAVPRA